MQIADLVRWNWGRWSVSEETDHLNKTTEAESATWVSLQPP